MEMPNTSVPTRFKKYQHNWYAVAAVATALQMSADLGEDIFESAQNACVNIDDIISRNSPATMITAFDHSDLRAVSTTLATNVVEDEDLDYVEDIAIKPKYIQEFKIKVGSLKVDKSLPKIFID